MSRRSFWLGVLVGLVVMGVVVASLAGLVMLRSRGMLGPVLGLRARSFEWARHGGRFALGFPARAFGGLLCLPVLLLVLGAVVLIAVFAGHRCWRRGSGHYRHEEQKPVQTEIQEVKETGAEPQTEAEHPAAES